MLFILMLKGIMNVLTMPDPIIYYETLSMDEINDELESYDDCEDDNDSVDFSNVILLNIRDDDGDFEWWEMSYHRYSNGETYYWKNMEKTDFELYLENG